MGVGLYQNIPEIQVHGNAGVAKCRNTVDLIATQYNFIGSTPEYTKMRQTHQNMDVSRTQIINGYKLRELCTPRHAIAGFRGGRTQHPLFL